MAKAKEVLNTLCLRIGSIADGLNCEQLPIANLMIAIMNIITNKQKVDDNYYCEI